LRGWPWLVSLGPLEERADAVELGFEHLVVLRDPGGFGGEPSRAERAGPDASDLLRPHQPRLLEQLHVLLHAGEGHVELLGQLGDRRLSAPQSLEDPAPRPVGDRGEYGIEV